MTTLKNRTTQVSHREMMEGLFEADFDAIAYLNTSLPSLNLTSQNQAAKQNRSAQLQSSSTDVQAKSSKFNAFNARTSTELTTLAEEILRSGSRLAYEVEVLRSDANSVFDLLSETLRQDIQHFVQNEWAIETEIGTEAGVINQGLHDPEFMQQLRLLGHIKARLEQVIKVFDNAMKWPIPLSDVSVASSLISVSAPELGVVSSAEDDKARLAIRQYREEISDLLNNEGGVSQGIEAAQKRLEDFQNLALVWKGTAEEKARNRVVDGFAKIVDDRKKALGSQGNPRRPQLDSMRQSSQPSRTGTPSIPAGGLLGGLRKLRDEIYLD
ncbi:hypothetical protein LTR05_002960 [Lithohypha guttulata]|uniref:Uncharacterized protein n=1 Tax=Lithohypha guttulata TaxID=1690604 RepID=A0AAN7YJH3_9EURO|nr:hypothetical protein LTR05_002960 [Lithohypha guttulata]